MSAAEGGVDSTDEVDLVDFESETHKAWRAALGLALREYLSPPEPEPPRRRRHRAKKAVGRLPSDRKAA